MLTKTTTTTAAAVVAALLAVGAPARGDDIEGVKARLVDAELRATPWFPTWLPAKMDAGQATLATRGSRFTVRFDNFNQDPDLPYIVTLRRGRSSEMAAMLRAARRTGGGVKRVRIRKRTTYYIRRDVTFSYAWRQQGLTYAISSKYYGGISATTLRRMVASMRPVR